MADEKTEKKDWLNDFFSTDNSAFVSSHKTFASKLNLPETDVSLRFIGNKRGIDCYLLVIILSDETLISNFKNNKKFEEQYNQFVKIFKKPFLTIVSVSEEVFFLKDSQHDFSKVDTNSLKAVLAKINRDITDNAGTFKTINKTTNDTFQTWTRKNLSKFKVINDFDVIRISSEVIIFELKRVKEDSSSWEPYLDDLSNYIALDLIKKENGFSKMLVISYNADVENKLSVHKLLELNESFISGEKKVILPEQFSLDVILSDDGFNSFKSARRRT